MAEIGAYFLLYTTSVFLRTTIPEELSSVYMQPVDFYQ